MNLGVEIFSGDEIDDRSDEIRRLRLLLAKGLGIAEATVSYLGEGEAPGTETFIIEARKELGI